MKRKDLDAFEDWYDKVSLWDFFTIMKMAFQAGITYERESCYDELIEHYGMKKEDK